MKLKMNDDELIQLLYHEFPYLKEYVEHELTVRFDLANISDYNISYITIHYVLHKLITNEVVFMVTTYYTFFNINDGNIYKMRRAIYHWIKHNEDLLQLRML